MNSKIKQYIVPIVITILLILMGYLIYESNNKPIQEGLETRIRRKDGKIVKRRKKKPMREGLFNPFKGINELINGFKRMINFFKLVGRIFGYVGELFRYLFKYIQRVMNNIAEAFKYIPRVFVWLGSYIAGGMKFITNLNKCFGWYGLDAFGQTLYLPVKFIFWIFGLQEIEKMLWKIVEDIDCMAKKITGYHLTHYPDSIQDRCYSFCPDEFPEFPKMDWSFNPPSLSIDGNV